MERRTFLTLAGAGAVASAASAASLAQVAPAPAADLKNYVVDGSDVSMLSVQYLDLLNAGGVDVVLANGITSLFDFSVALDFIGRHDARIALVRKFTDIAEAKRQGKVAWIFGWQFADFLQTSAGNRWDTMPPMHGLRAYYELGLRCVGLAYNVGNQFAGGCLDPTMPLTKAGRYLAQEMQEMGILMDCGGHTGEQSSLDIISLAKRPVVCTHSNAKTLNDNPRATSDRVIEDIARTGGVFGVNAISTFLTWGYKDVNKDRVRDRPPTAKLDRFLDEIDYLMRLVGPDHIGIGPDFTHGRGSFKVDPTKSFSFPIEMTFGEDGIEYVQGFEDISKLGNVRAGLVKRNYSKENIDKILGGNWMRVYQSAWNI